MASSQYHRKQAEILAGLALTAPDETKATRLTLLALEHHALAEKLEASQLLSRPPPLSGDDSRNPA
jgi:hypothetical protein